MALAAGILFILHWGEEAASLMCIFASILDYFDGWYARKFKQSTKLGAHLDPFADKVLIAIIFLSLSFILHWLWFVIFVGMILLREALITIYRIEKRRISGVFTPASKMGKIKTAVQCIVGSSLLFYIYIYPGKIPTNMWFVFFIMTVTLFITVDSGLRYLLPSCSDGKKRSAFERLCQWIFGSRAKEV